MSWFSEWANNMRRLEAAQLLQPIGSEVLELGPTVNIGVPYTPPLKSMQEPWPYAPSNKKEQITMAVNFNSPGLVQSNTTATRQAVYDAIWLHKGRIRDITMGVKTILGTNFAWVEFEGKTHICLMPDAQSENGCWVIDLKPIEVINEVPTVVNGFYYRFSKAGATLREAVRLFNEGNARFNIEITVLFEIDQD